MAYVYRSIQLGGTGIWTAQRLEDTGLTVTHQVLSVHHDQNFGNQWIPAKDSADAAGAGYAAEFGGSFDTSTDPFEF